MFTLPQAFNLVDSSALAGVRVAHADAHSSFTVDMLKETARALDWSLNLDLLRHRAGIDHINENDYLSVIAWLDYDGIWHPTLEGDFIATMNS